MAIADPEAALTVLREFRSRLVLCEQDLSEDTRRHFERGLFEMQPLAERIAGELDPTVVEELRGRAGTLAGDWYWSSAINAVDRLIGTIERQPDSERIFGPVGPTLAASGLHPWVWNAAADLWDGGHHGPAVHAAAAAVELQTQLKAGRRDLHGKDLYAQAFSEREPAVKMPRLRFSNLDRDQRPDDWNSAHEGAKHLGMGCAQGIRNPRAHASGDVGEQEALEQLAALSVLARWVDDCDVVSVVDNDAVA